MKLCYVALLDVYKDIEQEMEKKGYQYRLPYALEAVGHIYLCILFSVKYTLLIEMDDIKSHKVYMQNMQLKWGVIPNFENCS